MELQRVDIIGPLEMSAGAMHVLNEAAGGGEDNSVPLIADPSDAAEGPHHIRNLERGVGLDALVCVHLNLFLAQVLQGFAARRHVFLARLGADRLSNGNPRGHTRRGDRLRRATVHNDLDGHPLRVLHAV